MQIGLNHISIIVFYLIIAYFIYKNRSKIEFHKIYLLYRTKAGIKLIDRIAKWRFWKFWGYAGIPVGFIGMAAILWMLFSKFIEILTKPVVDKSVQLLLPGVSVGSVGPFMFMPFWTFIICITIIILVHEGAHGIISRVHDIKVNSTGLGIFTIIPLAFVEPDEKQLEKAKLKKQLSIFAAGPFANICTAAIVMLISAFILVPAAGNLLAPAGLDITDTISDFPAETAGIIPGDTILAVNNVDTLSVDAFILEMYGIKPGDLVKISLKDRDVSLNVIENPQEQDKPYLGVSFKQNFEPKSSTPIGSFIGDAVFYLVNLFSWLALLNVGIALVNLLPMGPVDGGRMVRATLNKTVKNSRKSNILWLIISTGSLALLLINIFGPIIM
jgi:membrane-associated protease RseP (regulator of RpoE activity)